ncbi:MAG: TonB family protein [Rhodocyclaceae bacterium]|nr:TonB family protein [Rhodocyclaceae bacterium]MBX3667503.1 TonB family protein [Rhodocyclaceae bacterium]
MPLRSAGSPLSPQASAGRAEPASPVAEGGHYVPASLLPVAPVPLNPIVLDDQIAPDDGLVRRCVLKVYIDARGHVSEVRTESSSFTAAAEQAAIAAFAVARFEPGRVHGVAVNSYLQIELELADPSAPRS